MQLSKYSTLTTIAHIINSGRGNYSFASQAKYLEIIKRHYGITFGKRQINYHLADMQHEGLIERIKRMHRGENGKICYNTSAICITIKGWYLLAKRGIAWAWKKMNELKKRYMPQQQKSTAAVAQVVPTRIEDTTDSVVRQIQHARNKKLSLYEHLLPGQ